MNSIKVIFVGNSKSGKTTIVEALNQTINNQWLPIDVNLIPISTTTLGVDVAIFNSQTGLNYKIWDCAGDIRYGGLREGYYIGATIACIFGGGIDGKSNQQWVQQIRNTIPNATIYNINGTIDQKYHQLLNIFI